MRVFERKIVKIKKGSVVYDLAFLWLCNELEYAAYQGIVLKLDDVWNRHVELTKELNITIPASLASRKSTFKDKIEAKLGGIIQFYRPLDVEISDRQTIIIPTRYQVHGISQLSKTIGEELSIPSFHPEQEDEFLALVHVALKIRSDITKKSIKSKKIMEVREDDALECIPESLYMFLRLLYRGQDVLDDVEYKDNDSLTKIKVISMAQDIIYHLSKGKL